MTEVRKRSEQRLEDAVNPDRAKTILLEVSILNHHPNITRTPL
jgi:hypothetical protein